MSFADGFRAGFGAVEEARVRKQKDTLFQQQQEDRQRQEDARNSYQQLQKDYYTNSGEFAPKVDMSTPEAQTANASYDRLENQRLGIPQQPTTPGVTNQPGLSMTNQQLQSTQPQAPSPEAKDQMYYAKLGQWAQTHLPPEKAMAYMNDLDKFKENNYQQIHTEAARAAASGDRAGLDHLAQLHNGLIPDGYHIDSSKAQFDPSTGDWSGVFIANNSGDVKPLTVDHNVLQKFWAGTSLPNVLAERHQVFTEDQANKKDVRETKALDNQTQELGIRSKVADSTIKKNDAEVGLSKARIAVAQQANQIAKGRLDLEGKQIGIAQDNLNLNRDKFESDEDSKQSNARLNQFIVMSGYNPKFKADPLDPNPQGTEAENDKKLNQASTMYGTYQLNAQGLKDKGARNQVQAKVQNFFAAAKAGRIDFSKVSKNPDGTYQYDDLKLPSIVFQGQPAQAPTQTPGLAPRAEIPGQQPGLRTQ